MIGARDCQCVSDCIRLFSLDRPNMFSPGTRNHFVFKHVRDCLDSVHVTEDIGHQVGCDQGRGSCHENVTPLRVRMTGMMRLTCCLPSSSFRLRGLASDQPRSHEPPTTSQPRNLTDAPSGSCQFVRDLRVSGTRVSCSDDERLTWPLRCPCIVTSPDLA